RFVVLRHDSPAGPHWDFMLEFADTLRTWALQDEPTAAQTVAAHALPDHRPAYLDYEGPVSGDRGSVERFDRGTFDVVEFKDDLLVVQLAGSKLMGRAVIERVGDCWEFRFVPD
ncbi:MAG: DNA polymerase ligase N-terminal domain-containing protein, partial [Planctomycetota bacterium]|nr:DNA polymerase ligase N-terminal domain-containing protein [Planctomycetota bacterium]